MRNHRREPDAVRHYGEGLVLSQASSGWYSVYQEGALLSAFLTSKEAEDYIQVVLALRAPDAAQ